MPVFPVLSAGNSISGASADWNEKTIRDNLHLVEKWQAEHPKNARCCISPTAPFIPAWCSLAWPFRKVRAVDPERCTCWTGNAVNGKPFEWYMGAVWDKVSPIQSAAAWETEARRFRERVRHPLQVRVR